MAQKNTLMICVLVAVLSTVYCSKTKSSKECKENGCGDPMHVVRTTTIDGCTGELLYGECEGYCKMESHYSAIKGKYYTDTTCCRPGCFEEQTATLTCGDASTVEYDYMVPTHCECDSCLGSEARQNVAGSLFAANCDDNLTVYYDGVKQMPYQGAGNIEDYNRASHFMMDRYNGPLCNRPSLVTIVCEELFGSMGGIIASNRQEFVTDGSWDCMRDGVAMNTTVIGLNGIEPWGHINTITPNANWIYAGDASDVAGEGPVVSCSKNLD